MQPRAGGSAGHVLRRRRRPRLKQARAVGAAGGAAGRGASAARAGASRTGAKAGPAPAAGGGKLMGREASTARPGALCDRRQPPRLRQGSAPVSPDLRLRAPAPLRRHNQVGFVGPATGCCFHSSSCAQKQIRMQNFNPFFQTREGCMLRTTARTRSELGLPGLQAVADARWETRGG